jgi:hypothetical protein
MVREHVGSVREIGDMVYCRGRRGGIAGWSPGEGDMGEDVGSQFSWTLCESLAKFHEEWAVPVGRPCVL